MNYRVGDIVLRVTTFNGQSKLQRHDVSKGEWVDCDAIEYLADLVEAAYSAGAKYERGRLRALLGLNENIR